MVIDKLGLNITAQQLASKVSATSVKSTVLMVVSVTDSNAQHAANIANGYGDVLATYIAKIENLAGDPKVGPLVKVVTRARSGQRQGFWISDVDGRVRGAHLGSARCGQLDLVPGTLRQQSEVATPGRGNHRMRHRRQAAQNRERSVPMATSAKHSTSLRNSNRRHCDSA